MYYLQIVLEIFVRITRRQGNETGVTDLHAHTLNDRFCKYTFAHFKYRLTWIRFAHKHPNQNPRNAYFSILSAYASYLRIC